MKRWIATIAIVAIHACTPSTFENLTGASSDAGANTRSGEVRLDPALEAPRLMAPISVSWVNTLRPRFRWAAVPGQIGAIVELSRTRDFKGEVQRFVGTGSELVVPENLAPGFWFWRARGRTDSAEGTVKDDTTVWELLVRGPSKSGVATDVANGRIDDRNGDGVPELSFSALVRPAKDDPNQADLPLVFTLLASADGTYLPLGEEKTIAAYASHPESRWASGSDLDGDGFPDFVIGNYWINPANPAETDGELAVSHGSASGIDEDKDLSNGSVRAPTFDSLPGVELAGDVNGDGYGDIAVLFPSFGFLGLGSRSGAWENLGLPLSLPSATVKPTPTTWPGLASGACDVDSDGLSDLTLVTASATTALSWVKGSRDRLDALQEITVSEVSPGPAIALASGDFDGNGKIDLAFTTLLAGAPAVCIYTPNAGALTKKNCWLAPGDAAGFGTSLAAGDLDADGKDELIVGSTAGIVALRQSDDASFEATPVAGSYLPSIGMIHPGRPEPATWAVVSADRRSVVVYQGLTVRQTLDLSKRPDVVTLGPAIH